MLPSNGVAALAQDEAYIYNGDHEMVMPTRSILSNYNRVKLATSYLIGRSYEQPCRWFLVTFKPFSKNYEKDLIFYKYGCMDHCRKKLGRDISCYVMTREIDATKVHVNILCCTKRDLESELHDKKTNRYYIYAQECNNRHDTFEYIIKESHTRVMHSKIDYQTFSK